MAAGLGFKDFTTGEVLTAADVDGYLMQGIWVFASAAARDAAVTSPQEGNFAFTKDTNGLWYYDGAAWVASGATGDIEGVTAGVGISGGGTSGTVTITNSMATAIDAKGDLIVGTGADTFSRLAVGATNGHVLQVDSAEATGMKWAAAAGGTTTTLTLINTGGTTPSGTTTTISGLSGYNRLLVVLSGISTSTTNQSINFHVNGDTSSKYSNNLSRLNNPSAYGTNMISVSENGLNGTTACTLGYLSANADIMSGIIMIDAANSTGTKLLTRIIGVTGNTNNERYEGTSIYTGSSVISSISFNTSGGNWDVGTIYVYGSN